MKNISKTENPFSEPKRVKNRKRVNKKKETLIESPSFFLIFLFIGVMIVFLASRIKETKGQDRLPIDQPLTGDLPVPLIFDEEWSKYLTSLNRI